MLQSIHDPSAETRRMLASSTHLPAPQSGEPSRHALRHTERRTARADYEHMGAIEGYRVTAPAAT